MENTLNAAKAKPGKYLTFRLENEDYGVEILKVREIIGMMGVTRVPKTPDFIRGVINLRGMVIPVVDLRNKFGLKAVEDSKETCIIVVEIIKARAAVNMGIVVDSVSEVLDIPAQEIEDTPSFGIEMDVESILGMAKSKGGVKILLNIDRVLTELETVQISDMTGQAKSEEHA